jgi:hypothetical protein
MRKLFLIWEIVFFICVSIPLALSLYAGVSMYYLIKPKKNEKK